MVAFPTIGEKPYYNDLKSYLDAQLVQVGYTNHSIMEFASGATIGDGVTSAAAAITAAQALLSAGSVLYFPPGTYLDDAARTISTGIHLMGDGATIKKGTTTVSGTFWLLNHDDAKVTGLAFDDTAGKITGTVVGVSSGVDRAVVAGCTFTAPSAIIVQGTACPDLRVRDNYVISCASGVIVNGASPRADVSRNRITNWKNYGIYASGDASGATTDMRIVENQITDLASGGTPAYAFHTALNASPSKHDNMLVQGNRVTGPGRSYTAAVNPGIADGLGIFNVNGLKVIGNTVTDGGDMGITVDGSCVNVAITGNVCRNNDSGGIAVATGCTNVAVTGNTCVDNGQNRNSDRVTSRVGIWILSATGVTVVGNVFGDDQGTPTQQYGAYVQSSTGVTFRGNQYNGLAVGKINTGAGNTGVEFDSTLLATKSADTVRNNTATLANDPHLTLPVEASAVYLLEAMLVYNATTTADIQLHLTAPASATCDWTMDAMVSTTTTTNGPINRSQLNMAATNSVGGAGAKVIALPVGRLVTSTTAGSLTLQWAQNVAEVSDATIYAGSFLRLTRVG